MILSSVKEAIQSGFFVFPLSPNSKLPWPGVAWKERVTRNFGAVELFVEQHPNANYAISTEFFEEGALLVVDVDQKENKMGESELIKLELAGKDFPPTFEQNTPSGGRHLFYKVDRPVRNSVGKLAPGIDIRSRGAYVVGFGSRIDGREYTKSDRKIARAPEWLVRFCSEVDVDEKPESTDNVSEGDARSSAIIRVTKYLQDAAPISIQGQGGNHTAFTVACKVKDFGVGREDALQLLSEFWNSRCEPEWSHGELKTIVRNAYTYGENSVGINSPEVDFKPEPGAVPKPNKRKLYGEKFSAIRPDLNQPFLVEDLLSPGAMTVVYGESNSGKTFIVSDLALHIALGQPWMEKKTQKGLVIYVAAEGGWGFKKRIEAFRKYHKLETTEVPFVLVPCSINLLDPQVHVQELIDLIGEHMKGFHEEPALIVIDTLSRALAGGNENAAQDMGAFVANVDHLRSSTRAHVIVIHHSGKDVAKGARGHSSLRAATDTEVEINDNTAKVTKQRDMDFCQPIGFRLEQVVIGENKDAKPISSCVVRPANISAQVDFSQSPLDPESIPGRGMAALRHAMDWHGEAPVNGMEVAEDCLVVKIEHWKKEFMEKFYSTATKQTRYNSFMRAVKALKDEGRVKTNDTFAWVP